MLTQHFAYDCAILCATVKVDFSIIIELVNEHIVLLYTLRTVGYPT